MINFTGQFNLNTSVCCGDKSISHRALMLAAIADGVCFVRNLSLSSDVKSTINCLRALGAAIDIQGETATVTPISKLPTRQVTLDCGNSGTTARLLAGLVAGLGVNAKFVGDKSLQQRPMTRVTEPLTILGARFCYKPNCLFINRKRRLHGGSVVAQVNSAQVKSAVLLAGLNATGETSYTESIPTRAHTETLLQELGCNIRVDNLCVTVSQSKVKAFDVTIPNDPSAVAYGVALALTKGIEATFTKVLLDEVRVGFYEVLKRSGANIQFTNTQTLYGEKVGDVTVKKSKLKAFKATETDVCNAIDEVPLLATLALTVEGTHEFQGVSELQFKESNRVKAIEHIVATCGQQCNFDGNDLTVTSDGMLPANLRFNSFNDHRIAMCETVLSLTLGGGSVDNAPFEISNPKFLQMLGIKPLKLGLIGKNVTNSKSPMLMAHFAKHANVCCSYETVNLCESVTDTDLLEVIDSFDGLNVTMPFKRRVATLMNAAQPSVNTIGKNVTPCSTDGYGILKALTNNGVDFKGKPLWIVGAGGAAEACVAELQQYGCQMQILNRTKSHAKQLIDKYNLPAEVANPAGILSFVPQCSFEERLLFPGSVKFVFVADYKGYSNLRTVAIECELPVIDGLEMLYHQGARSFALWTGTEVQDDYQSFLSDCNEPWKGSPVQGELDA